MTRAAKPFFILARPLNCLITFIAVWVGAIIAGHILLSWEIALASISAALIAGYGYIVNDLFDIRLDKINKPFRPLVSGPVSAKGAIRFAIVLGISGIILSIFIHKYAILIALTAIVLLTVYTPVFKGLFYAGNILVAFISSLAFVYGGMAVGNPWGAGVLVAFSFLLHLGREIVKDIEDRNADSHAGLMTAATINAESARGVGAVILIILILATLIPFIIGLYGIIYLVIVILGVDLILVFSIRRLFYNDDPETMRRVSKWLKAAMPIGLLAVFLGSYGL